jgi:hypothetical protein
MAKRGRRQLNVGIISRNPEKSKHLETATMRVGGFWIDFVNLRTEAYTEARVFMTSDGEEDGDVSGHLSPPVFLPRPVLPGLLVRPHT